LRGVFVVNDDGETPMSETIGTYCKPTSVPEAQRLLRRGGESAAYLAGGTSLLTRRRRRPQTIVDLSALGLDYIRHATDEHGAARLEIGAMTTLQTLVDAPLLASYAGGLVATAAHHTATRTIRNAATVGGSIAACGPTTDVVVALLALHADVVAGSGRVLTLEDVLASRFPTQTPRLYTEVRISDVFAACSSALLRVARLPSDQAIVNVAVALQMNGDVCVRAAAAAGGIAEHPQRLSITEAMLAGHRVDDAHLAHVVEAAMEQAHPPSDSMGSAEYRRAMLGVLLRRAVLQCVEREARR